MQRAEQPETDAVVATEVDNVVEELRVAMSVGPAPGMSLTASASC